MVNFFLTPVYPIESGGLFLESLENFSVVKLQSACFEKLIFHDVFNVRKTKRIAKFDGLEPRRLKGIQELWHPK